MAMTRLPLLPDREERVERISATTYSVTVTRSACAFPVSVTACVNAGARNDSTAESGLPGPASTVSVRCATTSTRAVLDRCSWVGAWYSA
jgi:hypothetical protein